MGKNGKIIGQRNLERSFELKKKSLTPKIFIKKIELFYAKIGPNKAKIGDKIKKNKSKLSFWAKKSLIPKGISGKFDFIAEIGVKRARKYGKI